MSGLCAPALKRVIQVTDWLKSPDTSLPRLNWLQIKMKSQKKSRDWGPPGLEFETPGFKD
uniref:Uncharacterized protein n=1 Tax=Anguilla anguilla TaxID=7936 RepID=A0A0E9WZB4_ANGAN